MKGENFGSEVRFWIYDVKKIEEDEEKEDGKEGKICSQEILKMSCDPSNLTEGSYYLIEVVEGGKL